MRKRIAEIHWKFVSHSFFSLSHGYTKYCSAFRSYILQCSTECSQNITCLCATRISVFCLFIFRYLVCFVVFSVFLSLFSLSLYALFIADALQLSICFLSLFRFVVAVVVVVVGICVFVVQFNMANSMEIEPKYAHFFTFSIWFVRVFFQFCSVCLYASRDILSQRFSLSSSLSFFIQDLLSFKSI